MLLTKIYETISRRAKTAEELQKLLDVSGSTGIEAISSDTVKVIDFAVVLQKIITPGQLPFKFQTAEHEVSMRVLVPTLRDLQGMEGLTVRDFELGRVTKKVRYAPDADIENKLTSLRGMPKTSGKIKLNQLPELKTLDGLNPIAGATLELYNCPQIVSLAPAQGVIKIDLMGCNNVTFQSFPHSCQELNLEYLTLKHGLPWFITIPPTCKVKLSFNKPNQPFYGLDLPPELAKKIVDYQRKGRNSKVDMLEIQADLIEADFDELAEI